MRWSLLSPTDMWDTRHQWKLSNLEVVQGFSAGSLTAWIVRAPAEVGRLVDTPAGGEQVGRYPHRGVKRHGLPPPGVYAASSARYR